MAGVTVPRIKLGQKPSDSLAKSSSSKAPPKVVTTPCKASQQAKLTTFNAKILKAELRHNMKALALKKCDRKPFNLTRAISVAESSESRVETAADIVKDTDEITDPFTSQSDSTLPPISPEQGSEQKENPHETERVSAALPQGSPLLQTDLPQGSVYGANPSAKDSAPQTSPGEFSHLPVVPLQGRDSNYKLREGILVLTKAIPEKSPSKPSADANGLDSTEPSAAEVLTGVVEPVQTDDTLKNDVEKEAPKTPTDSKAKTPRILKTLLGRKPARSSLGKSSTGMSRAIASTRKRQDSQSKLLKPRSIAVSSVLGI